MHARFIAIMLFVIGCSSSKPSASKSANEASVRPIDAAIAIDAAVDEPPPPPPVDAATDAPAPVKHVKATPKQHKPCPACGIGCPHGVPSRKTDENGCSVCACEDFTPILTKP